MQQLIETAPTWGLNIAHATVPIVGPISTFDVPPELAVTVIEPGDVPAGTPMERVHVRENAQEFDITYYQFEGYKGLRHEGGQNWILWTENNRHVFVSRGPEAWRRTWTYAKFILRHYIVAGLMARPGYRRIHAVAGTLPGLDGQSGILVAGPYLSGKTYLLERLVEQGIATELVEDDCAVIDPEWRVHFLIPAENERRTCRTLAIRAMVCLDKTAGVMETISPQAAAEWAFPIQASWPLSWMPGGAEVDTRVEHVKSHLVCLRVPEKPPIEEVSAKIRGMVEKIERGG